MTEQQHSTLRAFESHANSASFHYADDSGKEWGSARSRKRQAMALYESHPDLREHMRPIGERQLWALDFRREAAKIDEGKA